MEAAEAKRKQDAYDKSVKELAFDLKARASDRLKTPQVSHGVLFMLIVVTPK